MNIKKRIIGGTLALVATAGFGLATAPAAQAVAAGQDICNSRGSTGRMNWSTESNGTRTYHLLDNGDCINVSSKDVPSFRVQFLGSGSRWKVANNGGAYGPWHDTVVGHDYTPATNDVNWYRVEA